MFRKSAMLPLGVLATVAMLGLSGVVAGTGVLARTGPTRVSHAASPDGYGPGPLAAYGIRFTPESSGQPAVDRSQAISDATGVSQAASGGQLLPGVQATAEYGLFSDDALGHTLPSGGFQPSYQNVPAWIVTFSGSGLSLPSVGGPRTEGGSGSGAVHHEQNIVIDAQTGVELLEFD